MPNREPLDRVFSAAYEELRRLALAVQRSDAAVSLSPTALVHEAWLKLAGTPAVADTSPLHFRRIAARAMRQVLVEAARRRLADKRGGGALHVTLDDAAAAATPREVLALHDALEQLAALSPRQAAVVEQRFFGGLGVAEIAEELGVSESTVEREWRAARAWLGATIRATT